MASRWSEGGERGKTVSGLGDPERSVRGATQRTKTAGTRTGPLALGRRGPQVGRSVPPDRNAPGLPRASVDIRAERERARGANPKAAPETEARSRLCRWRAPSPAPLRHRRVPRPPGLGLWPLVPAPGAARRPEARPRPGSSRHGPWGRDPGLRSRRVHARSPGVPRRGARFCPPPRGPQETTRAPCVGLSFRDRSGKVRRPCPPNPRPGPGKPRTAERDRNFLAPRARSAAASSRLPALSPCARRQIGSGPAAGRAGGEDARLPGDGGPGSAASCRGGGRAGAAGPRADRPPPWLAGRCSGRPPQRGRAGPGVRFRLVEAEGALITRPFPAGPQAGPRPCNERLWRPVALGLPRLLPSCVGVAAETSSPEHTRSQLESTDPPPGPVRGHDTPGQVVRKSASCSAGPQVPSAPALGGHASGSKDTFSALRGFRGLHPRPSKAKPGAEPGSAPRSEQSRPT